MAADLWAEIGKAYNLTPRPLAFIVGANALDFTKVQSNMEVHPLTSHWTRGILCLHIHFQRRHSRNHCRSPTNQSQLLPASYDRSLA